MGEWRELRLGDLVSRGALAISDGYRVRNEELGPEGVPFVRGGDIGDGWINTKTIDHIRPQLADRVRAKLARAGDIAFITKGTVGRAGRLRSGQPTVVFAPQVAYWRVLAPDVLDAGFLFYLIQSHSFQSALNGVKTHGSMVADYVSISLQHEFSFRFPEIRTQRAIAHILGTIDDKIDLNRRMNETLEAMVRGLYKSWFVDFDPVRAKAAGCAGSLPESLTILFPASLVNSDFGEIPEGWKVGSLRDVCALNPEVWSKETRPLKISYIDLSNVKWGRIASIAQYGQQDAPSRAQRVLRTGDSIVGTVRPGNGSYVYITAEGLTGSTGFAVLRPQRPEYAAFAYFAATARDNIDALSRVSDGGAYPAVRPEVVAATPVVLANGCILEQFARLAEPILKRIAVNEDESRTLTAIRDTLLPKLISGDLRVKDSERIASTAQA